MSKELQASAEAKANANAEAEADANPEAETPKPNAEPGAASGEDSTEEAKPKKHRFQKRINEITKQKGEIARERDTFRSENEELKRQLREAQGAAKPDRNDYVDMDEFETELLKWSEAQASSAPAENKEVQTADEIEYADRLQNTKDAAADKYDDFDDKINAIPVLSFELAKEALDSEISEDLLYYLGNNHDAAETLSGLKGAALTREVGKLEAKLEAGILSPTVAANTKPVSKAPDPIEPVGGDSRSNDKVDDELSTSEWMKRRGKQVRG